ncbi:MAG: GatB/YqeY domain-containing protein [Gammaproteobacteria bacterium]|nr:GatB/YqeY domain-containing protein [Gammaproteobacteria bacterium]
MSLKNQIKSDMKDAMRASDKQRLSVIRMLLASIQKREIDERRDLDEAELIAVIEKQIKQHRDSANQYTDAGRDDRAAAELSEAKVLSAYLPEPLSDAELDALIERVVNDTGASSMKDMGKVMATIKSEAQGRADMGALSGKIKARLAG